MGQKFAIIVIYALWCKLTCASSLNDLGAACDRNKLIVYW